jgi:hypothetical protein
MCAYCSFDAPEHIVGKLLERVGRKAMNLPSSLQDENGRLAAVTN